MRIDRKRYAEIFGPTTGDRVRLGDTDLWLTVEDDRYGYGDEIFWGFGKTTRPGLLQRNRVSDEEADSVITGALVFDPLIGVVKASIGIRDGRIIGVGRAGNPDTMDDVDIVVGPGTTAQVEARGLIATAGAIDTHMHEISPKIVPAALAGGVTTLISAGFSEPPDLIQKTLVGFDGFPVNVGLQANCRSTDPASNERLLEAGACGIKLHEDTGVMPDVIDAALRTAEEHDVPVCMHTDSLNESAEITETVAAIAGRTVHAYHIEGGGGGHIPDVIGLLREENLICSSTTQGFPYGPSAAAELPEMVLVNHNCSPASAADRDISRARAHDRTIAAEGPLHEIGAISITNTDSNGMGRTAELVRRTWQLAHVMRGWKAPADFEAPGVPRLGGHEVAANNRLLRYLAKYTTEPARTHGILDEVGTLAPGRLADVVLWRPDRFGVKPEAIVKGGTLAWGGFGEGNSTSLLSEPVVMGPWMAGMPSAAPLSSVFFVSGSAPTGPLREALGTRRRLVAVHGTRGLVRADMLANRTVPPIEVDPRDGTVTLNGDELAIEPCASIPLNRRQLLA